MFFSANLPSSKLFRVEHAKMGIGQRGRTPTELSGTILDTIRIQKLKLIYLMLLNFNRLVVKHFPIIDV